MTARLLTNLLQSIVLVFGRHDEFGPRAVPTEASHFPYKTKGVEEEKKKNPLCCRGLHLKEEEMRSDLLG